MNILDDAKIEISFIIDDNTSTIIHFDLNHTTKDDIINLVNDISQKYHLTSKVKKKLFNLLTQEITHVKQAKEKENMFNRKREETFKRLYYVDTEKRKEQEKNEQKQKKELIDTELKKYSFTPRISYSPYGFDERKFVRIEDKLYRDHKVSQEKKNFQRLLNEINQRNEVHKKNHSVEYKKNKNTHSRQAQMKDESVKSKSGEKEKEVSNIQVLEKKEDNSEKEKIFLKTPLFRNDKKKQEDNKPLTNDLKFTPTHNISKKDNTNPLSIVSSAQFQLPLTPAGNISNHNIFTFTTSPQSINVISKGNNAINSTLQTATFPNNNFPALSNSYTEKFEKKLSNKKFKFAIDTTSSSYQVITPNNENAIRASSKYSEPLGSNPLINGNNIQTANSSQGNSNPHVTLSPLSESPLGSEKQKQTQKPEKEKERNIKYTTTREINTPASQELHRAKSLNNIQRRNELRKTYQKSDEKWYERLHNSKEIFQPQKENMRDRYYKVYYPFEPKISQGSREILMRKRPESTKQFINRLTNSKKNIQHSFISQKYSHNSFTSDIKTEIQAKSKIISQESIADNKPRLKISSIKCDNLITSTRASETDRKKISDIKYNKGLYQSIQDLKDSKMLTKRVMQEKFNDNLAKFKLNNLKRIYEILTSEEKFDIKDLSKHGIPSHIQEKLILPTIGILRKKKLEFNFQNFLLIANEILNKFF